MPNHAIGLSPHSTSSEPKDAAVPAPRGSQAADLPLTQEGPRRDTTPPELAIEPAAAAATTEDEAGAASAARNIPPRVEDVIILRDEDVIILD